MGYQCGEVILTKRVRTAGKASQIMLMSDRQSIRADNADLSVVYAYALDAEGNPVMTADHEITFSISGNARILGVANGDPSSHERDKSNKRRLFSGCCMLVVQSSGAPGDISVLAQSSGLVDGEIHILSGSPS